MKSVDYKLYHTLVEKYKKSPNIYQATDYWEFYEKEINKDINNLNPDLIRSGIYNSFCHFGFNETLYKQDFSIPFYKMILINILRKINLSRSLLYPYSTGIDNIREIAYRNCLMYGENTNSMPIDRLEASSFGAPQDFFVINGKQYTMRTLSMYLRYCFVNDHLKFKGNEIIVELGTGSGHQIEVIKKLYPKITILSFDLPAQLFLSNIFLSNAIGEKNIADINKTINWVDLSEVEEGKVHFFGNFQFPILDNYKFDLFWNAASFGEMEIEVVKNYSQFVSSNANMLYILNARDGKETTGINKVKRKIKYQDYVDLFNKYKLIAEEDAYYAHKKMDMSGGYFHALWKKI